MAKYIERTEELVLAMNAGARAIENTRRYHGAVYTRVVFSEDSQEIPYLLAAKVLREVSDAPTVDAVVVTRCKDCAHSTLPSELTQRYGKPGTLTCHNRYSPCNRRNVGEDDFCSYGEPKEGNHADDHD